jgi:hypothetical protein
VTARPGFTCARCGRTSHHPLDVADRYCGHCHIYIDQWLCFRVLVGGELVDQHWFDSMEPGDIEAVAERHARIRDRAEAAGLSWALDVYDPSADLTARVSNSRGPRSEEIDLSDYEAFIHRVAEAFGWSR